ncbi:hypothetical protein JCM17380_27310 [Desulfosporosinus burensis]
MSLFKIDQDKCKRDGICAKECPTKIISFTDKDGFPSTIDNAEDYCLDFGHCVAECPTGHLALIAGFSFSIISIASLVAKGNSAFLELL